tara:strand:+ start:1013 stop:1315 length:303 start_codon:yes stop_codon:yes gene_type:complete
MANKNKSASSKDKPAKSKDGKAKKDKKTPTEKKVFDVMINEDEATKIVQNSKVVTIHDLARQTNVKISTANAFLKKLHENGSVTRVGGFSGHHIYAPVSK